MVASLPVTIPPEQFPFERFREQKFVGAKIYGTAIVNEFLNAYYFLTAWDDWKEPNYLDKLLLSADKKPSGLIFKKS